jgi:hypothetical protein
MTRPRGDGLRRDGHQELHPLIQIKAESRLRW